MADKQTIRPIYSELQGCLAQAPETEKRSQIYTSEIWGHYNSIIKELNEATGKDYNKYCLVPKLEPKILNYPQSQYVNTTEYRQKLGGLIARLYGEYFSGEQAPFENMPSTVIHQNQNQSQSVQIEFLLEVNNLINDKLKTVAEGTKEKSFLEKVRGSLSKVKNVSQLIPLY